MLHKISLTGLTVHAFHGVFDFEKEQGQEFGIDATLWVKLDERTLNDDVANTVDYGVLADSLVLAARAESVDLIETLAQRLLQVCLAAGSGKVVKAAVTVHKPHAPIQHQFSNVSVTVKGKARG